MTQTEAIRKEHLFELWLYKNYKPNPKKEGWYIDKVARGAESTKEGAKNQFDIIYPIMEENNDLHLITGK
jgi:hypothetical protein